MSFDRSVEFILKHEGGYVNHPRDPGGETNMGIAKKFYPDLDIKNLTKSQAIEIYRRDYWERARCHEMPAAIAHMVFDSAVNQGISASARILQRSLKVRDDGVIGPVTLAAIRSANQTALLSEITAVRGNWYAATRNVDTFGLGWFRRLIDCYDFARNI